MKDYFNIKLFRKDIPRVLEALSKQKDIYSSIAYQNIKGECERQGWCENGNGKRND